MFKLLLSSDTKWRARAARKGKASIQEIAYSSKNHLRAFRRKHRSRSKWRNQVKMKSKGLLQKYTPILFRCYLLTIPGLETRWEKDGRPLQANDRIKGFESRGVRGLTIRNLTEADSGIYSVRVNGRQTNLYSQCRISVVGELLKWRMISKSNQENYHFRSKRTENKPHTYDGKSQEKWLFQLVQKKQIFTKFVLITIWLYQYTKFTNVTDLQSRI